MARPREFDRQDALEQAMRLFWEHGYERTSVSQLLPAMGISAPTLYATFGDKRQLFDEALALYRSRPTTVPTRAMSAPTAAQMFEQMIDLAVVEYSRPENPRGCMVISDPVCVQERRKCRAAITARLRRAARAGELPASTDPRALADFVFTVLTGLSTYARDGATRRQLQGMAAVARSTWSSALAPHDTVAGPSRSRASRHRTQPRSPATAVS